MAAPKVFVSSTCYDLSIVRNELRSFIAELGYEPQMSEYSDLLFDPRMHTHSSCVQEVSGCDILVLIIGSRFGGKAIPEAVGQIDFSALDGASKTAEFLKDRSNLSITQLEVLKAIEVGVPVFSFVESGVLHDHLTYERNKGRTMPADFEYPNIDRQETARYIFEFINFLRQRTQNNAITTFARLDDIRDHLRKQWAGLLQRLLFESRFRKEEGRRIDFLINQIADIKTAIFTSISDVELKETARGAIRFRMLVDFLSGIRRNASDFKDMMLSDIEWPKLIAAFGVKEFRDTSDSPMGYRCAVILTDGTHFRARLSVTVIQNLRARWDEFRKLKKSAREAILAALLEYSELRPMMLLRHVPEPFVELAKQDAEDADEEDVVEASEPPKHSPS